jgi:ubiquinone/menaquinone biosynthesis C-methylase UbiE
MKDEAKHIQLNKKKWDKRAGSYDGKNWRNDYLRNIQSELISSLGIKENINFLDVGCGTGFAVGEVARLANNNGQFYGVDLSAEMIEKAKSNFSGSDNFHFIQANAESIPLDNDFFDIIICSNSFHHYLHPDKALREMYRLLKKGGKLYILDPTADNWIIKIIDKTIFKLIEPEHVKLYSTKEFQQLFEYAGSKYTTSSQRIRTRSKVHIGEK